MSTWLDTETKALLQRVPPEKCAPPDTCTFTLVLLRRGWDRVRMARYLTRIPGLSKERAATLALRPGVPVASSLSLADALLGQFELICCDSSSIFLRDEVVSSAAREYLSQLYSQFQQSREFEKVIVTVSCVPRTVLSDRVPAFAALRSPVPAWRRGRRRRYGSGCRGG
jgi:hypothetical protein